MLIALDGVTDPRNLGAVIRSAAAFGAHGVFLTERRAAGMTATAWRTSAGAAARMQVSQVTNLTRSLKACQEQGFSVVGLDADGEVRCTTWRSRSGRSFSSSARRGVGCPGWSARPAICGYSIPMASEVESLNASVAAAVALAEVARRRG